MNVVAPPPGSSDSKLATPPADESPKEPSQEDESAPAPDKPDQADKAKPAPSQSPKQPGNGVAMAIVATAVIVLGLAALAVLAYLNQK